MEVPANKLDASPSGIELSARWSVRPPWTGAPDTGILMLRNGMEKSQAKKWNDTLVEAINKRSEAELKLMKRYRLSLCYEYFVVAEMLSGGLAVSVDDLDAAGGLVLLLVIDAPGRARYYDLFQAVQWAEMGARPGSGQPSERGTG